MVTWNLFDGQYGMTKRAILYDAQGDVVDLSGKTVSLQVWTANPAAPVINEDISVGVAEGEVDWTVSQSDADALEPNLAGYHAQVTAMASGYVSGTYAFSVIVRPAAPPP